MKHKMHYGLAMAVLALLVLFGSSTRSQAQFPIGSYTNNFVAGGNVAPFSGSGSVASWIYWYDFGGAIVDDVLTPDPNGGADAGSLEVISPFGAGGNQDVFFGTFGNGGGYDFSQEVNLALFDTINFDVYMGPGQAGATNGTGDYGSIQVGIINAGYGYQGFGSVVIPGAASNGWVSLSVPIDHTQANEGNVPGIAFDYNNYGGYPHFQITNWIGHLVMHYNGAPPPPPTNYLIKVAAPGLVQFADKAANYSRQDIRTDQSGTPDLTWIGHPGAKYSWTIAAYPGTDHPDFISSLSITPDPVGIQNFADADWSASNDVWIALQNNADGTATMGIAWKTNQPSGNAQLYDPTLGQLIPYGNEGTGLTDPSPIGTWSVTFVDDTHVTLTAPSGATQSVVLPADVAALFNTYVGVYLDSAATTDNNIGQSCTYSDFAITGVGTPINEDLTTNGLHDSFLVLNSQNYFYAGNLTNAPPNQIFANSNDAYWWYWTLPAAGYSPISTSDLDPTWANVNESPFLINGGHNWLKLTKSDLPSDGQGFFELIQRQFTKLQVLLPGETNNPALPNGKGGTPNDIHNGDDVIVTVNAVDDSWNIVPVSGDEINLDTSDDSNAATPLNSPLTNGTMTGVIEFDAAESWTITATDATDGSKTAGTETFTALP